MIVTHPPTIISIVHKATERGLMISPDVFDGFVAHGMDFTSMSDREQETFAAMWYRFEPDAVCFRDRCGCKVAYCKPWRNDNDNDNGSAYYIPACKKHRTPTQENEQLCGLQTLGAGVNAFCFGRTNAPVGEKHALYYLAGLPHDDGIILDYFMTLTSKRGSLTAEKARKSCGLNAVAVYTVMAMEMRDALPYEMLKEEPYVNLLPFVHAGRLESCDLMSLLADYKRYMVRKEV